MSFLRVGVAKADITPPVGTRMAGYIQRRFVSKGIHDRLFAKVLYLSDNQTEAALVSIDSLAVDRKLTRTVRDRIEQTMGIPGEQVNIAATHTHSGPSGLAELSFGGGYDDSLLGFTVSQIAKAVQQAREGVFEARLKAGSTAVTGLTQNRSDPTQTIDEQLHVLRIEDAEGRLRAVLANYPCHPTFLGFDNLMISADWPGAVCAIVEKVLDEDVVVMMTNGASSEIHPMYLSQSPEDIQRIGQVLGGTILTVLGQLWPLGNKLRVQNQRWGIEMETEPHYGRLIAQPCVRLLQRRVSLPLKEFRSKQAYDEEIDALRARLLSLGFDDETLTVMVENPGADLSGVTCLDEAHYDLLATLNALLSERMERDHALTKSQGKHTQEIDLRLLSLDPGLAVLFIPGELSSRIGLAIKQRSSLTNLIIMACANDYVGYLIPAAEYPIGGYDAGVSHFSAQAETVLIQAALDLIAEACSKDTH